MKVLIIPDSPWAIGHLTEAIVRHNPRHQFRTVYVHPRGVEEKLPEVAAALKEFQPDVVHFQYWRTAQQLIELLPELKSLKTVLTHHNQKNLLSADWNELGIKRHVCHTRKAFDILSEAGYERVTVIQHGIDLGYFTYAEKLPAVPTVGYCGRIVPWKGLKEIAVACKELNIRLLMMGKMDKPDYWESIPEEARAHIDLEFVNATDEERIEFYRQLTLYVGNSGDNHEEGTLPFLEALACGVPVATTPSGEAADLIEDGRNGVVIPFNDAAAVKDAIAKHATPSKETDELRRAGWQTVKNMDERKMAWQYATLYNELRHPGEPLVSVILPTFNRKENVLKILDAIEVQTWKHVEVIVADDGSSDGTDAAVAEWRKLHPDMSLLYLNTGRETCRIVDFGDHELIKDYGLARARNEAATEAQGEYLLFLDSRLLPDRDAIRTFLQKLWVNDSDKGRKVWAFGEKGSKKETFVENFSMIRRDLFISGGMCCERIDRYGGQSQELRERFKRQGFDFLYLPAALAEPMEGSHLSTAKRQDIIEMKLRLMKMGL